MDTKINIGQLKEAMETLKNLGVPAHLQDTALKHLLSNASPSSSTSSGQQMKGSSADNKAMTGTLREFTANTNLKNAVAQIPALLYWAKKNEGKEEMNEMDVIELYRRGDLRPPKAITQSFRDLSSKRYMRLESIKGKKGYFRLSRTGEDFVIYDLLKAKG